MSRDENAQRIRRSDFARWREDSARMTEAAHDEHHAALSRALLAIHERMALAEVQADRLWTCVGLLGLVLAGVVACWAVGFAVASVGSVEGSPMQPQVQAREQPLRAGR